MSNITNLGDEKVSDQIDISVNSSWQTSWNNALKVLIFKLPVLYTTLNPPTNVYEN